jgi:virulence-associated protein VapD
MRRQGTPPLRVIPRDGAGKDEALVTAPGSYLRNSFQWSRRVYAITFDLDTEMLAAHYRGPTHTNGYDDIRRVFEEFGFARQQGSVYFSQRADATPVTCVLAVQELVKRHPWFRKAVRDIRMLRIEENNDLMPAVGGYGDLPLSGADAAD